MALTPCRQENSRIVCGLFTGGRSEKCRSTARDSDAALPREFFQGPVLPDLVREQSLQRGTVMRCDMLSGVLEAEALRVLEGLHQDDAAGEFRNRGQVDIIEKGMKFSPRIRSFQ